MRFDMTRAWTDAMSRIGANREMMMVVAGVFLLLPSLLVYILYADEQAKAMSDVMQILSGKAPFTVARETPPGYLPVVFVLTFVQIAGFVALTALLGDRQRPTVGEAIAQGFKSLPTLIGASLLVFAGFLAFALLAGMIAAISAGVMAIAAIFGLAAVGFCCFAFTRLSLLLPVVVLERQRNPVTALLRSWRLVKGSTLMLFLFYLLLGVVYMVLSLLMLALMSLMMGLMDGGLVTFLVGLLAGTVSAAANVIFSAVVIAAYRQLSGHSSDDIERTFG